MWITLHHPPSTLLPPATVHWGVDAFAAGVYQMQGRSVLPDASRRKADTIHQQHVSGLFIITGDDAS